MPKGKLKILKPFSELMSGKQVRFCIERFKTINAKQTVSKKYFPSEHEARKYFEENKQKKNLVLTRQL